MKTSAPVPLWAKKATKKLIDRDMSKKELADELKVNYKQLVNVMTGYVYNKRIQDLICEYLEL